MKSIHRLAALAVVAILAGCGEKGGEVTKPSQGPAAVGPAPIAPAKTAAARPPATSVPVTTAKAEPAKTAEKAKPAPSTSTPPPAPRKFNLFGGDSKAAPATPPTPAKAEQKPAETKPAAPAPAPFRTSAKVVMVKNEPEYRFVVIEFTTADIPSAGSQLTLYRGKERVAAVKVTDPVRPPHVTADILDGQPRVGDEVR
ncbi:MAG: hypothetical protein HZA91_07120 [Verrucomicrobia bacterium]|nr:hypothetical protein [Verrucomicrobiota bacterium]